MASKTQSRKPLKILQPSSENQPILVGRDGIIRLESNKAMKKDKVKPINDENVTKGSQKGNVNKVSDEAQKLMVDEHIPEDYWKKLAERRRIALEEALTENEELHKTVAALKTENEVLKEMASRAEELSEILKSVTE